MEDKSKEKAKIIEETLKSFGIGAEVTETTCGAAFTRYELIVSRGTKVSSIKALEKDLQLALAAYSLRIEAPVPGKTTVAIEIPNDKRGHAYLKDLVKSDEYAASSPLTVPLGEDVYGRPVYCNLAKMPHLLIAGMMGTGTVMCYNVILNSILEHASPEDVRMILIDPKVIEFYSYKDIPHLLVPVINDSNRGIKALMWAVNEMERRLKLLGECQVRDIEKYNEKFSDDPEKEHLSYLLIMVSELSELMLESSEDVEACLSRLAPLSRAAGIHLVLATQRPTTDVITRNVYNNIGSKIAFAVKDAESSKAVIHECGAEKLIGHGDMLYSPITAPDPLRVQGAFVSDEETEAVVHHLKKQYGDMYDISVLESIDTSTLCSKHTSVEALDPNDLFNKAAQLVISTGSASVSVIQKELGIGFPRAAKLIDEMEKAKIIGAFEGTMPRKVLVTEKEWQERKAQESKPVSVGFIDKVIRETDFEAVVSRYVDLFSKGDRLWGLCPFHKENTPSFSVLPQRGIYKCFGCGKVGTAVNFIMDIEHLSHSEAINRLADLGGIDTKE